MYTIGEFARLTQIGIHTLRFSGIYPPARYRSGVG